MPRISVVIPAYNRGTLIGETLRSLLTQTMAAYEIIVVDDGSSDDTAAIAASFGSSVKVIRQANAGPGAARNAGFKASSGDFIHFFDSDDLAAANKHEVQVSALETSGADIAYGPWIRGRFCQDHFFAENQVFQQRGLPHQSRLIKSLLTNWSIVPHAAMFRRSIVEKAKCFPNELFCGEDQIMFLNCLLAGARVIHTANTIEFYRAENADKITESKDGALRRALSWARSLVMARQACLIKGVEPLRWFGYRRRLWNAEQELKEFGCDDKVLLEDLHAWVHRKIPSSIYSLHRQIERWTGGLQRRLTGGRAHRDFKIGNPDFGQIDMLSKLGYKMVSCHKFPKLRSPKDQGVSCGG